MRGCAYSLHLLRHFPPFPHTLSPLFRRVLEECSKPASAISHGSAELLKPVNAASQRGCGSNRSVEKSRVCGGLFSSSPHLLQHHKLVHLAVILVQSAPRRQRAAYSFLFSSPLRSSSSSCEKAERERSKSDFVDDSRLTVVTETARSCHRNSISQHPHSLTMT